MIETPPETPPERQHEMQHDTQPATQPETQRQITLGHWYKRHDGEIVGPATTEGCMEKEIRVGGHYYYEGKHNGFRRGHYALRWVLIEDLGPTDPREAKEMTTESPLPETTCPNPEPQLLPISPQVNAFVGEIIHILHSRIVYRVGICPEFSIRHDDEGIMIQVSTHVRSLTQSVSHATIDAAKGDFPRVWADQVMLAMFPR